MKQQLQIGTPVKPMLVSESGNSQERYTSIVKKHKTTQAEIKSDGYRVQVHKDNEVELFTRNLNRLDQTVFPELEKQLSDLPEGIFDGELVGVEDGINGFNAVKKRVRGTLDETLVTSHPLKINFFDVLNLEGSDMISNPLSQRRSTLERYVENTSSLWQISDEEQLREQFETVVQSGFEGLVCKDASSLYKPGGRTKDWIKLKKFLTFDLTILGTYKGEGKLADLPFAALLLGTRHNGTYQTVTKVGLSNPEKIATIYERIKPHSTQTIPEGVEISNEINKSTYARKVPDSYVAPRSSVVVEVETMNVTKSKNWHTCGYDAVTGKAHSLRIPVVREVRLDKTPRDCTTTAQIGELYKE